MRVYKDRDADVAHLKGKLIAVLGYGSQGSAQAQCFRDSGLRVIVGARKGGKSWRKAKHDGFRVVSMDEAAKRADIICMLTSDSSQPEVYERFVRPHLAGTRQHLGGGKQHKTLYFSHGFNITYKLIKPPRNTDVIMVAPHGPGRQLRELFVEGKGLPALLAIHQDASGHAKRIALALAKACGFTRTGVFEAPFNHETFADLFSEQAVLCGGVSELVKSAYETLVRAGIEPELAWFCCLYELKLTVDLLHKEGIEGMWSHVSETAHYGGRIRGRRVIGREARREMQLMLKEIMRGEFARELAGQARKKMPRLRQAKRAGLGHGIERTGRQVRRNFNL
ncbi:MAG: ketol-acid reductoisomerase [Candidatus Burarchaeum sp.]|nr:ketol-acid reductoisomerase [Candidatus Burarchaeum sp.]MDO8339874.1 ketol-acid reductoisomerase [Candidatus Burarchaeum sp.]